MRLIDADAMLLKVDLIGTNKFGMLDEDIRKFISEQPTVNTKSEISIDWSKVPVDTPILVRDQENELWKKEHFAKYKNNKIYTWLCGRTSWSATATVNWKYAKLAEESE